MKNLLLYIFSIALFSSCSKDKAANRPMTGTDQVFVRIQNQAGLVLGNIHIGTTGYGNVAAGDVTAYEAVTNPIYEGFPYCRFINNGNEAYAGYLMWCGTPPLPPVFEPGYYTFTVEPAAESGHYDITVTKQ